MPEVWEGKHRSVKNTVHRLVVQYLYSYGDKMHTCFCVGMYILADTKNNILYIVNE